MATLLSYFTYYIVGFLWTYFLRRWASTMLVLMFFGHFWLYGGILNEDLVKSNAFRYWLPLTAFGAGTIGYIIAEVVNIRRAIFMKNFDSFGCWIYAAVLQWLLLQATVLIWEFPGTFVKPVNYIVTFVFFLVQIVFWYFVTVWREPWSVWGYKHAGGISFDDSAGEKFYGLLALYTLSATILFVIFSWAAPSLDGQWPALIAFCFHTILTLLIYSVHSPRASKVSKMVTGGYDAAVSTLVGSKGASMYEAKATNAEYQLTSVHHE
jgi:hypothetical protein